MATQSGEPRKVRWTVPAADTSVIEWLNEQTDISQSIRLLIRESIQRDGYIDVYYRPVERLPRHGRPPLEVTEQREDDEADAVVEKAAPVPVAQPEPVPAPVETAEEPTASAASAPPEPPKQASIDEIMASTRR